LQIAARQELAKRNPDSLLEWCLAWRSFQGRPMRLVPALQQLYEDRHPLVVIQKAAQVGISEFLINTALWVADTGQGGRGNALYVMPTQGQVDDFSQARFDKAVVESPHLQSRLFPPPPGRQGPARQRLKKVGAGYIYLRGADSRRQLTSVDADVVLLDEYDLMGEGVLDLAQKRLASSRLGWLRLVSTPRLPEAGINALFLQSDQRYYFLPCPHCHRRQRLEWHRNVDLKGARIVCRYCRKPLDLWAKGEWVPEKPGNDVRGYHISRLYSPRANLRAMIAASEYTTPSGLREFHNSDLGETFVPPGGRLSYGDLDACRGDYEMLDGWEENTYMGVDVGTKLQVVVRQRLDEDRTRALFIGEVDSFEDLDGLMTRYHVDRCVVDALPEQRLAREFAKRWRSESWVALYDRHEGGHQWDSDGGVSTVHINRIEALEEMFDRFHRGLAQLPRDARRLGGRVRDGAGRYYGQMTALTRDLRQNSQGNWVARYLDHGKADHYAHAEAYCLLACKGPPSRRIMVF
jgi:hypothetical protein